MSVDKELNNSIYSRSITHLHKLKLAFVKPTVSEQTYDIQTTTSIFSVGVFYIFI
jgi:ribosomal protein L31E